MPCRRTFAEVPEGGDLLYMNRIMQVSFALNCGELAQKHGVASGAGWSVRVEKSNP